MAKKNLNEALDVIEMNYTELSDIAKNMTADFFKPVDKIIEKLTDVNTLTNDELRNYMIQLSLAAYSLVETREKSSLKAEISATIRKEAYAQNFSAAEGSVAQKDSYALLESSAETAAEALYNLVANLFKIKTDSCYRLVDVMKSVLMSRNMEAKLSATSID